jgi:hypothetical protein
VLYAPATLLGTQGATEMLALLAKQSITIVTFASDDTLAPAHHRRLLLDADGTWSTHPILAESRAT